MNAITYYSKAIKKVDEGEITIGEFERMINVLRDVEPVVRCGDCKFSDWYTAMDGNQYCYCMEHGSSGHQENDYCSYGEKDGDHHEG